MKYKTKKRIQGSITILMVIILVPMMTLSALVVDSSRINMARSMISSAGDLAMNSALADYDTILKDVYGLFAMSQNKSSADLSADIQKYFEKTLVGYGVTDEANAGEYVQALMGDFSQLLSGVGDEKTSNFMDMQVLEKTFKASGVDSSSLANADVMRKQIVEYMKYRAPINLGLSFLDSLSAFSTIDEQTAVVEAQVVAQESAQDVTSACKTAIDSIRKYDDMVINMGENGSDSVKGLDNSTDGKYVPIIDYEKQLNKYKETWGENYKNINRINLVFLANAPAVSNLYLSGMGSAKFISSDATSVNTNNSGINVSVSHAADTAGAKQKFDAQRTNLANYKTKASTYFDQNFLPINNTAINSDNTAFVDETKAVNTYIAYEKFMLSDNSASYKYSDAKVILEEIYKLAQYYTKYKSFLDAEVTAALNAKNEAQNVLTNAQNTYNTANSTVNNIDSNTRTYANNINSYINSINNSMNTLNAPESTSIDSKYSILFGIKNSDNEDLYAELTGLKSKSYSFPGTKTVSGKSFYNFGGYMNRFKENSNDSQYFYIKLLNEIANSDLSKNPQYKAICKSAKDYVSAREKGSISSSFGGYQKNSSKYANNVLYTLFEALSVCNNYVKSINNNVTNYNNLVNSYSNAKATLSTAKTNLDNAQKDFDSKKQVYDKKVEERTNAANDYKNSLSGFLGFTNRYQQDLASYSKYQATAKSVIGKLSTPISTQFSKIQSNLKKLSEQLGVIQTNVTNVDNAIIAYEKNVATWETKNNGYANKNGSDTFSNQNSSEIKKTETEYNRDSLNMLLLYVKSEKENIDELYNFVVNSNNYNYGNKKISSIKTGDDAKSAVSGTSLSSVVTVNDANSKFSGLYKTGNAPDFMPDLQHQLTFIEPEVVQIQFLKYLNTTFPEESKMSSQQITANQAAEANYNKQKDTLKEQNAGTKTTDENVGKYGYTYSTKTVPTKDLPSQAKDVNGNKANTDFKLSDKDDGDIDASSGFSAQKTVLSTILGGLGDALSAGLENTYILSYIFENFSCNTTVQSLVRESVGGDKFDSLSMSGTQLSQNASNFEGKAITLSNYPIDGNYNFLYGAEIEYILYGNTNPGANVNYAKGCIYALRFAFDCIYAFTNAEIKASTMAAGLAVQAATCGIVPYQIVQIVLQLALAAAEAAIDLKIISNGGKVAVVKTNETWNLSMTGIANEATNALNTIVNDVVTQSAKSVAEAIKGGVQSVVDASVDGLAGSINNLADDMAQATEAKATEVVETAFSYAQDAINSALNEMQYKTLSDNLETAKSEAVGEINRLFNEVDATIDSIPNKFTGNEIAQAVFNNSGIITTMKGFATKIRDKAIANVNSATSAAQVGDILVSSVTELKGSLITLVTNGIVGVKDNAKKSVNQIAQNIKTEINGYANQCVDDLTEEGAKAIKDSVSNATNGYLNNFIAEGNASGTMNKGNSSSTSSTGNSIASVIKFGYKDYLMLFTFLAVCVNDDAILKRVADVIQLNFRNTGKDTLYSHPKKASFLMTKAYTYVTISADVSLDMLFLDMDFFKNVVSDDGTEVESDFDSSATIKYKGLLGY